MDQTELDSIAACRSGNLQAFDALYELHVDAVYKFLYRRVRVREIAEDLTSIAFMKALESIRSFDPAKGELRAWLYRIARNALIDHRRRPGEHVIGIEHAEDLPDASEVTLRAERSVDKKRVEDALKHLKPLQREIVLLRVWEELSYKEIAKVVGKSEGNCKILFFRAMTQLRTILTILVLVLFPASL